MMNRLIYILLLSLAITSCQRELDEETKVTHQLRITFKNKVDSSDLQLGNTYQNAFGESYTISMFKYYISNISLQGTGVSRVPESYHLVNEAEPASKTFIVDLDKSQFSSISFLIGVDSLRNVSGTQTGDLDPLKGMFWTWNTGYVMAKIEATSPVSTAPNNNATFHIGGFKTGENTTRMVTLNFGPAGTIDIKNNNVSELVIEANANAWFKGVHDLKIADEPVCTNPGDLANKFADNFATMFNVVAVKN